MEGSLRSASPAYSSPAPTALHDVLWVHCDHALNESSSHPGPSSALITQDEPGAAPAPPRSIHFHQKVSLMEPSVVEILQTATTVSMLPFDGAT